MKKNPLSHLKEQGLLVLGSQLSKQKHEKQAKAILIKLRGQSIADAKGILYEAIKLVEEVNFVK